MFRLSNSFDELRLKLAIELQSQIGDSKNEKPFANKSDCINRLLPFAFLHEPELHENYIEQCKTLKRIKLDYV